MTSETSRMGRIRGAVQADIPRLIEIRATVRENRLSDPTRVTLADYEWFIEHRALWVWEGADRIAGLSGADPRDGSIWALFVDPADEGQGIGQALLQQACEMLRASGHRMVTLSTDAGTRADRFYRRNGWEIIGRNAKHELIFRKQI